MQFQPRFTEQTLPIARDHQLDYPDRFLGEVEVIA